MTSPARTASRFIPYTPGAGGDVVVESADPDDVIRFWVDGDAFPRTIIDPVNGVLKGDGTAAPSMAPGSVLDLKFYKPGSAQTDATVASATMADITASGITASWSGIAAATLDLAVIVPASRKILVQLSAWAASGAAGAFTRFGLYDVTNGAAYTNVSQQVTAITNSMRCQAEFILDSAQLNAASKAGSALAIRPQWAAATSTSVMKVGAFGGPIVIKAIAL